MAIIQIDVQDVAQLRSIALQAYSDHYADTWYDGGAWYMQTFFSQARLLEELQDPNARFLFIYCEGTALGFLKLNYNKVIPGTDQTGLELERIYLIKSASGQGIGTKVLHWTFDRAHHENHQRIWLKVMDTSPAAVRFYQRAGFAICGTHHVDFPQKKEGMRGMYIMQKML